MQQKKRKKLINSGNDYIILNHLIFGHWVKNFFVLRERWRKIRKYIKGLAVWMSLKIITDPTKYLIGISNEKEKMMLSEKKKWFMLSSFGKTANNDGITRNNFVNEISWLY